MAAAELACDQLAAAPLEPEQCSPLCSGMSLAWWRHPCPNPKPETVLALVLWQEAGLVAAAELAWDQLAAHPATAAAAQRMTVHIEATPARAAARLGRSAWNAYSFNVDYRTGALRPQAHTLECLLL